ncbi:MAG TPA: metalloregulator ArsR/SmtB family transcription factor [Trueperaceae bacterium]|nr:metalloregulator ArsR/SmtB family transcription factor [Trueperaceae bacterium]
MVQYPTEPDLTRPLHQTFAALSDPTRMGFLESLTRRDASITELARQAGISLTGTKKHVKVLESAGLVSTRKEGRTRVCRLGPRRLEREAAWIANYKRTIEERLDHLGELLDRLKEES